MKLNSLIVLVCILFTPHLTFFPFHNTDVTNISTLASKKHNTGDRDRNEQRVACAQQRTISVRSRARGYTQGGHGAARLTHGGKERPKQIVDPDLQWSRNLWQHNEPLHVSFFSVYHIYLVIRCARLQDGL